jgi:DNA repair protein RecN (Recombination protein N)
MLHSLFIQNFAIIDDITIHFENGLTVITGETGAGKSILAGSLLLLLGNKFDISILKNKEKKCVVEAVVKTSRTRVSEMLRANEIETHAEIILRREVLPSGTSRCFINDALVNLALLKEVSAELIDIHSQHQNLLLAQRDFQLYITDALAKQLPAIAEYKQKFIAYKEKQHRLEKLAAQQQEQQQQIDFLTYQLQEFELIRYTPDEFLLLEQESNTLEHAEEIIQKLSETNQILSESESSVITQLKNVIKQMQLLSGQLKKSEEWTKRFDVVYFELKDLNHEFETELNNIQANPSRLEQIQVELDKIYRLYQKHHTNSYSELLEIKQEIASQLAAINHTDDELHKLQKELGKELEILENTADTLHQKRIKTAEILKQKILPLLQSLGIPNATFSITIDKTDNLTETGRDKLNFLFSANAKIAPLPIQKIASGGELSRVMLALKTIIAHATISETIFFDEIDAGISGETAYKMGIMMQQLSQHIQVIAITHLPQIAACGKQHKLVQKTQSEKSTFAIVKELNPNERITEIAKMLSAKEITQSAIEQATHLLTHVTQK